MNGKIIKGIGGLYCVATPAGDIFAKPRGIFRKNSVKPMIGDNVVLSKDSEETSSYVISDILARKNSCTSGRRRNSALSRSSSKASSAASTRPNSS